MSLSQYNTLPTNEHGYKIYMCKCCPYGYHIDLDFVQFCESIKREADHKTGSIKRRKDRRKQRKSMEVLLGIEPPPLVNITDSNYKAIHEEQNGFNDALTDFENTLQRSKNKLAHNLPDVTAVCDNAIRRVPSISSLSSAGSFTPVVHEEKDFDTVSIGSNGCSPIALHHIREQMVLSLERTKELEDQVKLIPNLQTQLRVLQNENIRLTSQVKSYETSSRNNLNANYLTAPRNNRTRSQSFTEIDTLDNMRKNVPPAPPPRKDFGTNCTVLTRNVGVQGHQNTFKLLDKGSQTFPVKEKRNADTQTKLPDTKTQLNQTDALLAPKQSDKYVSAYPNTRETGVQNSVQAYNIGVSDDTVNDVICDKCDVPKRSIAVGVDSLKDPLLSTPRSKSFNLGDDKLDLKTRKKTIGVQYDFKSPSKASQYDILAVSKATQSVSVKTTTKGCQPDQTKSVSRQTDTQDLSTAKHVACEAKNTTLDVGTNTLEQRESGTTTPVAPRRENSFTSRIPRPQMSPTPSENRKLRRQDTYTKISCIPPEKFDEAPLEVSFPGLSGLDLSPKDASEPKLSLDQVKKSFKLPLTNTTSNVSSTTVVPCTPTPSQSKPHVKAIPSKEMQGALKVLNDLLLKNPSKIPDKNKASDIIQLEWFKISSVVTANPLDVEDYLDAFEDMSSQLLQYIVNMTDISGNTAMHYAVSHGNFDVVSILLDSKVCDINKTNTAGYTSVMLVSLTEIRSQTHANVVRRLFLLADVNVRAKQHGQTALMLAVSHGRLDMVKMLLEAGADVNIQDEDGSTALMCAAEHGHMDIVKHFLSQPDCDSTLVDVDGSTALKIAMEAGHRPIGVLLYAHEKNLKLQRKSSFTLKTSALNEKK